MPNILLKCRTIKVLQKLVLSAFCILPAFPLASCGPRVKVAADLPVPVRVRPGQRVQQPVSVWASGSVEANMTAMTAFQISGRVARVYVEEGQQVVKGQILAELETADYRNGFDAAQAQADVAQAEDQKARAGLRPQELEQARVDAVRTEDEYARMKFLFDHQSLAANDFAKFQAAYKAAQQRYEMALLGTRSEEKLSAGAQFRAASAQMHEAQKHLSDCRLLAPISGFIGMRRMDVGDTVAAGAPVLSVLDLNPAKVRVGIPEAEVGKVHQGAHAKVLIPSLNHKQFEGKVELIGVVSDASTRTYTAKIAVPNPDHLLRAGMVAQTRLFGDATVEALTVPGDAIVRDARGVTLVYVYFPAQQRVFARRVEPGSLIGNELEIKSGLDAVDQIVVEGQQNVREGSLVRIAGTRSAGVSR